MTAELKNPELAYHYTDASGLFGVLSNGELWATDLRFLNDESELHYGIGLADLVLNKKATSVENDERRRRLVEFLRRTLSLIGVGPRASARYAVSLARSGDLIGQWRGYGGFGRGYALGFDLISIQSLHGVECREVIYQSTVAQEKINSIVDTYLHDAMKVAETDGRRGSIARQAAQDVVAVALFTKHPAFEDEREIRLLVDATQPKHRVRGDEVVPYVPVALPHVGNGGIVPSLREILLGPLTSARSEVGLREFLISIGYGDKDVSITRSEIPFVA
jgi:hypothetical protein